MNKKDLSERDICSKFISPAVKRAGWDWMMQIREEVAFTNASRPMSSVSRKFVSQ
jgi:type I restriction enzyme, R subunit